MRRTDDSPRGWGRGIALALALLGPVALLAPVSAGATYDPVGVGSTTLHLAPSFTKQLHRSGVKLRAVQGAQLRGRAVIFPSSAGRLDPVSGQGTIKHTGALQISKGSRSLLLKSLILKTTARRSPLAAKVGGGQLKLGSSRPIAVSRNGFGVKATIKDLRLTTKFAVRLDHKLGLRGAFRTGQQLGSSLSRVEPELATIAASGRVNFNPAATFLAKLNELHVALNPIHPAERPGAFELPIAGGRIAPDGSAGTVETSGSLEALQLGGGQIFWHELAIEIDAASVSPEVDVQPSPPYPGKVGSVAIATLGVTGATPDPAKRTVSLSGSLALGTTGAAQMNQAFAESKPFFVEGEALGTVSAVIEAK